MKKSTTQNKEREILGLPVYTILDGRRIGRIIDAVASNSQKKVSALLIEDEWYKDTSVILFESLQSVGEDAAMIQSKEETVSLAEDEGTQEVIKEDVRIIGKKVITVDGKFKGIVSSFLINPQTGVITSLNIKDTSNSDSNEVISGSNVVTFGKDALIVSGESEVKAAVIKEVTRRKITEETPSLAEAPRPKKKEPEKKPLLAETSEPKVKEVEKEKKAEVELKPQSPETAEVKKKPKKDLRVALEKNLNQTLLGKTVVKDVTGDDGSLIIKAGERVTEEVVEKAKKANRYLALNFFVKEGA